MYAVDWLRLALRRPMPGAPILEVYQDTGGDWRWRERVNGRVTASSGEAFASKWNARRAAYARAVRTEGATVKVIAPDDWQ